MWSPVCDGIEAGYDMEDRTRLVAVRWPMRRTPTPAASAQGRDDGAVSEAEVEAFTEVYRSRNDAPISSKCVRLGLEAARAAETAGGAGETYRTDGRARQYFAELNAVVRMLTTGKNCPILRPVGWRPKRSKRTTSWPSKPPERPAYEPPRHRPRWGLAVKSSYDFPHPFWFAENLVQAVIWWSLWAALTKITGIAL